MGCWGPGLFENDTVWDDLCQFYPTNLESHPIDILEDIEELLTADDEEEMNILAAIWAVGFYNRGIPFEESQHDILLGNNPTEIINEQIKKNHHIWHKMESKQFDGLDIYQYCLRTITNILNHTTSENRNSPDTWKIWFNNVSQLKQDLQKIVDDRKIVNE